MEMSVHYWYFSTYFWIKHAFEDESHHGGKRSKERITVLVHANMDGSKKIPLLVTEVREAKVLQAC
jgi:hypothetical protein